jgi:predicted O-methyltransferase YrrM
MSQTLWTQVDEYFDSHFLLADPALNQALVHAEQSNMPAISVSGNQGKFLALMVRLLNAKRVLEIGTLAGYSTLWMAQALPMDGKIITLEAMPEYAKVARENFERAGVEHKVEVRVGLALDSLPQLAQDSTTPFDLVFIDADKANNLPYFEWAMKLTRQGGLIIVDNVVRAGGVLEADSSDDRVQGIRNLVDFLAQEKRVSATVMQTVGAKGYDGMILATVL